MSPFASAAALRCSPVSPPSSNPLLQTAGGCLVILVAIVIQLELFGLLSRTQFIPAAFSRKLTHIGAGTAMTTSLVDDGLALVDSAGGFEPTPVDL